MHSLMRLLAPVDGLGEAGEVVEVDAKTRTEFRKYGIAIDLAGPAPGNPKP